MHRVTPGRTVQHLPVLILQPRVLWNGSGVAWHLRWWLYWPVGAWRSRVRSISAEDNRELRRQLRAALQRTWLGDAGGGK